MRTLTQIGYVRKMAAAIKATGSSKTTRSTYAFYGPNVRVSDGDHSFRPLAVRVRIRGPKKEAVLEAWEQAPRSLLTDDGRWVEIIPETVTDLRGKRVTV